LPAEFALAVMEIESFYDPEARGGDGEVGLMQVMPATARMMGFRGTLDDLAEPRTNIALGVRYLAGAFRLAGGDLCTTVMKYRAGHAETRFRFRRGSRPRRGHGWRLGASQGRLRQALLRAGPALHALCRIPAGGPGAAYPQLARQAVWRLGLDAGD
ncbi:transglycosylase SLT domain-containing protein, partial [Aminobacter sp. DSM 101952]|uniref:lytic transglycosylase domain-containing protein n=1 Tax=Aminobacter sp. DSM 101952 TaxID=2735891 RepID=UPI00138F32B7